MVHALLSFLLAGQGALAAEAPVVVAPEAVLARVAACGVKRHDAVIRMDDTLQEAVVDLHRAATLTDTQLGCLARVSAESYWFLIFDAETDARYEPLYSRASEAKSLQLARAWVAAHGLTFRVPPFDAAHDDPALVVAAIERLCEVPVGSFHGDGNDMIVNGMPRLSDAQMMCAINVGTVAGLKFGFIGNEAAEPAAPR